MYTILEFNESFRLNYFYRFCFCHKTEAAVLVEADRDKMRSIENSENDVINFVKGTKESCIWNKIPSFHISTSLTYDVMHDLLEGIFSRTLAIKLYRFFSRLFNWVIYFLVFNCAAAQFVFIILNVLFGLEVLITSSDSLSCLSPLQLFDSIGIKTELSSTTNSLTISSL